jgi:hypothetical protein
MIEFDMVRVPPERWGLKFYRYNVFHKGELVVEKSRDPEYDACRAFLAKNPDAANEIAIFTLKGCKPGITVRIGYGATICTRDQDKRDLGTRKWEQRGKEDEED